MTTPSPLASDIPLCPLHQQRGFTQLAGRLVSLRCLGCRFECHSLQDWFEHVHNLRMKMNSVNHVHSPETDSRPSGASGGAEVATPPVEPAREAEKPDSRPSDRAARFGRSLLEEVFDPLIGKRPAAPGQSIDPGGPPEAPMGVPPADQLEYRMQFIEGLYQGLRETERVLRLQLDQYQCQLKKLEASHAHLQSSHAHLQAEVIGGFSNIHNAIEAIRK